MKSPLRISEWTPVHVIANKAECNIILENTDALKEIPLINNAPLDNFTDRQLVRFRGMVQDMRNPEYYFQQYEVKNNETEVLEVRCGMYTDTVQCLPHEEILLDSDKTQNMERHTCVVISTPGLNDWAKEKYKHSYCQSTKAASTHKRNLDDNNCESMDCSESIRKREKLLSNEDSNEMDTTEQDTKQQNIFSKEYILNFPIPMDDGKACIVKIYEDTALKLNEVIEIIGFISLDPLLSTIHDVDETMTEAEMSIQHPPASLIPRLHAVKVIHLSKQEIENAPEIMSKAQLIRSDLHLVLSQLLFGDHLAADYLISHLLSTIYLRKDCLCLGTYPLNITHFPFTKYNTFTKDLYSFLSLFIEKSHLLEVTLENLNDFTLSPKKDYDCNRLTSGMLQLSDNTHLVIDETGLTTGQVSQAGRENYSTICDLINFQKVTYDFKFYKMEYDTDIPVLILSETKSFIPCQTQVALKIDAESENLYPRVLEIAKQYLKDGNRLTNIRQYLKHVKNVKFEFNEDIVNEIQSDFVKMRQTNKNVNVDHLHGLMILARLLSLSNGLNTLSTDYWKKAVEMEAQRLNRLPEKK
ncbi:mini-chromosome maintenance complex-binding protein [Hylaeus anthracinus]|uniref:mini-chromosome maintenance complex-binding protein n=1 Tax=Hylaeus anthracinus TaxID=313031 RepID=UPI0023B8C630|nr:mini-chromosome maintenance complex-binding protein [Hylaeus anthracinus]